MKKQKPTEKQCRACKATIDYSATRCRYCTAEQRGGSGNAAMKFGAGLMMIGCAIPFVAFIAIVVIVLASPSAKP